MKKVEHEIPTPVNANESLLYGINVRLDALINQMSSLLEHIAKEKGIATETVKSTQRSTRTRKKASE